MKLLGVDSTATAASVAVMSDGKLLAVNFSNTGLTHSQTLLKMVDDALSTAGIKISDIDAFAVSVGPGSFTGVRIGTSLVKGMAQPLGKKCVSVSTLEAIAKPLENTGVYAVSVMDARCNQVYTAQFDCEEGLKRMTEDEAISISDLTESLKTVDKKIVLIGDGARLCFDKMKDDIPAITIAPLNIRYQSAASVALIANEKINSQEECLVEAAQLLPDYLRLSQAERELKKKNEK